jgi:hypothetical protein
VPDAPALQDALASEVDLLALGPRRMRAVTHLDVDRAEIDAALSAIAAAAV